jgi:hypothetical protein
VSEAREVYRYEHVAGYTLAILRNYSDSPAAAVLDCDPDGSGDPAMLPPHEVPKAARALYEAAGLPVPDLPDIPDPAEVQDLADLIHEFGCGCTPVCVHGQEPERELARFLMADGWGRTA